MKNFISEFYDFHKIYKNDKGDDLFLCFRYKYEVNFSIFNFYLLDYKNPLRTIEQLYFIQTFNRCYFEARIRKDIYLIDGKFKNYYPEYDSVEVSVENLLSQKDKLSDKNLFDENFQDFMLFNLDILQ